MAHVLFVWKPTGYELRERDGELPALGDVVEEEDVGRMVVTRVGPSPVPGDSRRCAYLQSEGPRAFSAATRPNTSPAANPLA